MSVFLQSECLEQYITIQSVSCFCSLPTKRNNLPTRQTSQNSKMLFFSMLHRNNVSCNFYSFIQRMELVFVNLAPAWAICNFLGFFQNNEMLGQLEIVCQGEISTFYKLSLIFTLYAYHESYCTRKKIYIYLQITLKNKPSLN